LADERKLEVFGLAHELAVEIFHMSQELPRGNRGELGDQLRRASMSTAANIVEGCGRDSDADTRRHFRIALGSAAETEYFLIYGRDTGIIAPRRAEPLLEKAASVRRMTAGFIKRLS
jgi:four helix bundle protein